MVRKIVVNMLMIMLCITVFTGCSSKKEVRDRAFVQAAAVGYDDAGNITAVIRVFDDDEAYIGTGADFFEALDDAQQKQEKYFFTGHMEVIVSALNDDTKMLEGMIKSNEIPPSCLFVYDENAVDMISEADCDRFVGIIRMKSETDENFGKSIWNVLEERNS